MPSNVYSSPLKEGKPFTCAQLRTISFDRLTKRDARELSKLLAAGEEDGFFYLDLTSPASKGLYEDYEDVLSIMATWFEQPLAAKTRFAYGSDVQGYGPSSSVKVTYQGKSC